ncbi:MAG: Gfo/Idh/MocA family protein [Myxococcota bacterium]
MRVPRVAVVGVGHMGTFHLEKIRELERRGEARLAGLLDTDPARAGAASSRFEVPAFSGIEALAEAADAACLAVPTVDHAEVGLSLLRAGLDLLVEKPIAATRSEARRLIEVARERDRRLQIGQVERFSHAFRSIEPILNRPRFIEAHRIGPFPDRATDVGVVLDLMIHDLDIVCSLAGSEVVHVEAIGVPVLSRTEDIANARIHFANGCVLNLTASRVSAEPMRKIRLFQSDAYISIDFLAQSVTIIRREGEPGGPLPPRISGEKLDLDREDALLEQDAAFVRAVRAGSPPPVSGEDGYRALDLALRIQESLPSLAELRG